MATKLLHALTRRKTESDAPSGNLARCLTLIDLTALGVGGTMGLGVYVLAGAVAKTTSGPAVTLSFLVAAIASAVAGLCYAEFAARVPRAGSAYVYSYVSVGEFVAFIIGWNLILEYVIGTASVATGLTNYLDALVDHKISSALADAVPIKVGFLAQYLDLVSFGFVLLLTVLLSIGVKESTGLNNVFTVVNILTVITVIISGAIKATPDNWKIPKSQVPPEAGEGGFMPFGLAGVMAGAAKCFYGFVGFDAVATTGEEAKNPQKDIPLAIIMSLGIVFLAYFGISTVLTMAWPYYLQDEDAPLPYFFDEIGWTAIKWIVTIGAVFALFTSLLGAMFPLPRVLYAMSSDGLLFKFFSKVHPRFQTPLIGTLFSGLFSGVMAAVFDLKQLIDMMSVGTLMAYTMVAICVLTLRYRTSEESYNEKLQQTDLRESSVINMFADLFNLNNNKYPNSFTSSLINWTIIIFTIFSAIFCSLIIHGANRISPEEPFYLVIFILVGVLMLITLVIIARQPVDDIKLSFKVPLVPYIPCISIVINVYLMLVLDIETWVRFIVWLIIGLIIYFTYGVRNSLEGKPKENLEISMKQPVQEKS